ncbi:MAG: glycoside hydrolase family 2 TIM barrel-domain containing protein [bacterium]|nr:glycoside hydrolase family 2 TIM barrel-domain containing protein [bacterium]
MKKIKFILIFTCIFLTFANTHALSAEKTPPPTFDISIIDKYPVPIQNNIVYPSFEKQDRDYFSLDGKWLIKKVNGDHELTLNERSENILGLLEGESGGATSLYFDSTGWKEYDVPRPVNIPPERYQGVVWYRKDFEVPGNFLEKRVKLFFLGANYFTDVWINGLHIGYHEGGYTPFVFDITKLLKEGLNFITVRVDNIPWKPMSYNPNEYFNKGNIVPYKTCDWWNFTGILRNVYMEASPFVSISRIDVKTAITGENSANMKVFTVIENTSSEIFSGKLTYRLWGSEINEENLLSEKPEDIACRSKTARLGKNQSPKFSIPPRSTAVVTDSFNLNNIKLWSAEQPDLYIFKANLINASPKTRSTTRIARNQDNFCVQLGFRDISVMPSKQKILINGKETFFAGVGRHEVFSGIHGYKTNELNKLKSDDMKLIKEMNGNFLRDGHYPNHFMTAGLADRHGIYLWEEIPAYWMDGFAFDLQRKERKIPLQMFREMVYKGINNPSVIFWGVCNECGSQNERAEYIDWLIKDALQYDGQRIIAQSAVGQDTGDGSQKRCSVAGFTMYGGVFYGNSGYYADTVKLLNEMNIAFPDKPILATEFGKWSGSSGNAEGEYDQVRVAKGTFSAFEENPSVAGCAWWCLSDWHTMISEPQTMGLTSSDRKYFKPVFFVLQELYGDRKSRFAFRIDKFKADENELDIYFKSDADVRLSYSLNNVDFRDVNPEKDNGDDNEPEKQVYAKSAVKKLRIDTSGFSEGTHTVYIKAQNPEGIFRTEPVTINLDRIDDPPVITILRYPDSIIDEAIVLFEISDDRAEPEIECLLNGETTLLPVKDKFYNIIRIAPEHTSEKNEVKLSITASDGTNSARKEITLTKVSSGIGRPLELSYNNDWISNSDNLQDGSGWNFPGQEIPDFENGFIMKDNEGRNLVFKLKGTEDGEFNNIECSSQAIKFNNRKLKEILFLGARHNGSGYSPFEITFSNGTTEKIYLGFSDWNKGIPNFGETPLVFTVHHEMGCQMKPQCAMYLQSIKFVEPREISYIILPNDDKLHIFAVSAVEEP